MTRRVVCIAVLACLTVGSVFAMGQTPPDVPGRVPRAEVLRLFDAYAVVQAQEALGLDNARYGTFVAAYKSLLETRRRLREHRVRLVHDLGKLVEAGTADENTLRERLKVLQEHDAHAVSETMRALEDVDSALTVAQRVRFRVFEERMEQRKLDLLSRAKAVRERRRMQRQ